MKTHDSNVDHTDWLKIAKLIRDNYSQAEKSVVDSNKLLIVLQAFEDLYNARNTRNEERYFISNLIKPARLEGKWEEVVGTVSEAIERTRQCIMKPKPIYGLQASMHARNLVAILNAEEFNSDLEVVFAPYKEKLQDLSEGKT